MTSDDRRQLDRESAGCQPPAPIDRLTPPEGLPSRPWVEVKREKWYLDLARSPREVVVRALFASWFTGQVLPTEADDPIIRDRFLRMADAGLDAVAPLLRSPTFRSVEARRDAELRQALELTKTLEGQLDDVIYLQLKTEAQLQRYRESVRAMARIIQRKRAGANRQVAYYKRLYLNTTELLRRRGR